MPDKQNMSTTEQSSTVEKGSKSHTIEFINVIGNPSIPQGRQTKGGKIVPSHPVVGYHVRVLEDMVIPDSKYRAKAKEYDDIELPVKTREVKAGEIVQLTVMDMVLLISQDEFEGFFTGGDKICFLSMLKLKGHPKPRPVLRQKGDSIKLNMVLCAEGYAKNWKVFPEYEEKFGGLFTNKTPKQTQEKGNTPSNTAAALRQLYANIMAD